MFASIYLKRWKVVSIDEIYNLSEHSRLRFKVEGGEIEGVVMSNADGKVFYADRYMGVSEAIKVSDLPSEYTYEAWSYESMRDSLGLA